MKTYITTNPSTPTGYEVQVVHEDGHIDATPIVELVDDGRTLKLPANPSNRKYYNLKKVMSSEGPVELTYKETRTLGNTSTPTTTKAPTKGWVEYLTDEEKVIYDELKAKAEYRAQVAALKAQIAADQKRLAELEAQE